MRIRWIGLALAAMLLAAGCGGQSPANNYKPGAPQPPAPQQPAANRWEKPPAMQIDAQKQYFATIQTSLGDIRVELWPKEAPQAVNNFVFLARQGFYDGVIFHRIIKDFMIQGGDPEGTGYGGPGYAFAEELPPKHPYDPGILAMARTNRPNSQGSQFFICNGPGCNANLDPNPNYTQFGRVVEGMDVVLKISDVKTGAQDRPVDPPVIKSVIIDER